MSLISVLLFSTLTQASEQQAMKNFLNPIPVISSASCESQLQAIDKSVSSVDLSNHNMADLKSEGRDVLKRIWNFRLALHQKLPELNTDCQLIVRDLFHKLRDVDDYISDLIYSPSTLDSTDVDFQKEETPIFNRKSYLPYYVRPDLDKTPFEFRSGDIVLARGISFFSAIITQLSNNRSHFSHSFIVHVDNKTNKAQTIEAYVGKSVDKYDISFALRNENVRLMVLRPRDKDLAERAANTALDLVSTKALYDYALDFEDPSELSCVEVLTESFKRASNKEIHVPLLPAKLDHKNSEFIERMNLKNGELITPDDLEIDPRFELVLDWKDGRLIRNSRYKDAVLSEVVRWSNDHHYSFHSTVKTFLATNVLLPLRKSPLGPLMEKIPFLPSIDPHIPKKTLEVMTALDQVSQILLDEIINADEEYSSQHMRPMTNKQLRDHLEKIRKEDEVRDVDASLFHGIYRKKTKDQ